MEREPMPLYVIHQRIDVYLISRFVLLSITVGRHFSTRLCLRDKEYETVDMDVTYMATHHPEQEARCHGLQALVEYTFLVDT